SLESPILSIDLPSGLDAETGACPGVVVQATLTCTFVAVKPGLCVAGAERLTGQIHVLDIGAPRKLVEEMLRQSVV
ncbi:MAG: hypothetical protein N2C12_01945, partial [Planctomycetales bacterium]